MDFEANGHFIEQSDLFIANISCLLDPSKISDNLLLCQLKFGNDKLDLYVIKDLNNIGIVPNGNISNISTIKLTNKLSEPCTLIIDWRDKETNLVIKVGDSKIAYPNLQLDDFLSLSIGSNDFKIINPAFWSTTLVPNYPYNQIVNLYNNPESLPIKDVLAYFLDKDGNKILQINPYLFVKGVWETEDLAIHNAYQLNLLKFDKVNDNRISPTASLTSVTTPVCASNTSNSSFSVTVTGVPSGQSWSLSYSLNGTSQAPVNGSGSGTFTFPLTLSSVGTSKIVLNGIADSQYSNNSLSGAVSANITVNEVGGAVSNSDTSIIWTDDNNGSKLSSEDLDDLINNHVVYEQQTYILITNNQTGDDEMHLISDTGFDLVNSNVTWIDSQENEVSCIEASGIKLDFQGKRIGQVDANPQKTQWSFKLKVTKVTGNRLLPKYTLIQGSESISMVPKRTVSKSDLSDQTFGSLFASKLQNLNLLSFGYNLKSLDMVHLENIIGDHESKKNAVFYWIDDDSKRFNRLKEYVAPIGYAGLARSESVETSIKNIIANSSDVELRAAHFTTHESNWGINIGGSYAGAKGDISFGMKKENNIAIQNFSKDLASNESIVQFTIGFKNELDCVIDRSFIILNGQRIDDEDPGAADDPDSFYNLLGNEDDSTEAIAKTLLDKFGTHYMASATMGVYTIEEYYGTKTSIEKLIESGKKISTKSGWNLSGDGGLGVTAGFNLGFNDTDENDNTNSKDLTNTIDSNKSVNKIWGSTDGTTGANTALIPLRRHFRALSNLLAPPFFDHTDSGFYKIMTEVRSKYEEKIIENILGYDNIDFKSTFIYLFRFFPQNSVTPQMTNFFGLNNYSNSNFSFSFNEQNLYYPNLLQFGLEIDNLVLKLKDQNIATIEKFSFKGDYTNYDVQNIGVLGTFGGSFSESQTKYFKFIGGDESEINFDIGDSVINISLSDNFDDYRQQISNLNNGDTSSAVTPTPYSLKITQKNITDWLGENYKTSTWKPLMNLDPDLENNWSSALTKYLNVGEYYFPILQAVKVDLSALVNY